MLKILNTLSKEKETFEPIHPPHVGIYVCGPTVYDDPHLGHAKSYVSFDVIIRFLRALGYRVRYVQNITDVGHLLDDGEDRILKKAKLERLEPVEIAQKYERNFFRDMDQLNNLRPDISCRATGHLLEMIEMVKVLLEKGFAYETDGDVYFDVHQFKGYGKLSGRKLEELQESGRIESAENKRHPSDFALWKKADETHIMQWPSPWGMGYPGWHLECSVMSNKYLGESFDIHGGGLDNQFPHHECEIAQSEAATGKPFAKYWVHNNMVTVDGKKMSKSLGNFITLEKLFEKYPPMTIRFFILQGHYRSPQDFSDAALEAAQKGFEKIERTIHQIKEITGDKDWQATLDDHWIDYEKKFFKFMEDDFNTSGAISILFDLVRDVNENALPQKDHDALVQAHFLMEVFGEQILGLTFNREEGGEIESDLLDFCVQLRNEFRSEKSWDKADEIRNQLLEMGIVIEDGADGTKWRKIKK